MRTGFVHAACGPSQLRDLRADRRAALRAHERMAEITNDVHAFLVLPAKLDDNGPATLGEHRPA